LFVFLQILEYEEKILKTLNYNVTIPTAYTFLARFLKAAHANKALVQIACYILDGTLLNLTDLTWLYLPSQLAAGAILLARRTVGWNDWSPTLLKYSKYREEEVIPIADAILEAKQALDGTELRALDKKYSKSKFGNVVQQYTIGTFKGNPRAKDNEEG
jgi:cyclin B